MKELTVQEEDTGVLYTLSVTEAQFDRALVDAEFLAEIIAAAREASNDVTPATNANNADHTGESEQDQNRAPAADDHNGHFLWRDNIINLLLTSYENKKEDMETKRAKKVFEDIANVMNRTNTSINVTGPQCHTKINGLKKTYKKIIDHNNTSGNNRVNWPFFERMDEIFGSTRWARPVATASEAGSSARAEEVSVGAEETVAAATSGQQSNNSGKRKADKVLEDYLIEKKKLMAERNKIKKENTEKLLTQREKHHKEKMELIKALLNKNN